MYATSTQLVEVQVSRLRESPEQKRIHADFDPQGADAWLVEDIRRRGILVPLLILPDCLVKEGHRRLAVARYLKLQTVLCLVVTAGDAAEVFQSAQLGRVLTVYAKCVLYRPLIEQAVAKGKEIKRGNLRAGDVVPESAERIEQQWIQIEKVLGLNRRTLQRGVKLLSEIQSLSRSAQPDARQRAERIVTTFRNHGLMPALRLIDADAPNYETNEGDPGQWEVQDAKRQASARGRAAGKLSGAKRRAKSQLSTPSLNPKAVAPAATPETPVAPPVSLQPTYAPDQWQQDCYKALATLEKHLRPRVWCTVVQGSLSMLEQYVKTATDQATG